MFDYKDFNKVREIMREYELISAQVPRNYFQAREYLRSAKQTLKEFKDRYHEMTNSDSRSVNSDLKYFLNHRGEARSLRARMVEIENMITTRNFKEKDPEPNSEHSCGDESCCAQESEKNNAEGSEEEVPDTEPDCKQKDPGACKKTSCDGSCKG